RSFRLKRRKSVYTRVSGTPWRSSLRIWKTRRAIPRRNNSFSKNFAVKQIKRFPCLGLRVQVERGEVRLRMNSYAASLMTFPIKRLPSSPSTRRNGKLAEHYSVIGFV